MKIRLVMLDSDPVYLERIAAALGKKYMDKLEFHSFTDRQKAVEALRSGRADVFLADEAFGVERSDIPARCGFGYLVDSPDVDSLRQQRAVCRYQKADLLYRQILDIYSENAGRQVHLKADGTGRVLLFHSVSGGAGASSLAAACARHLADAQKKVLYLNLERFGSAELFFSAEGQMTMSDVIYALRSRKTNFLMKLESSVRSTKEGVAFYAPVRHALDMMNVSYEEMKELILALRGSGTYSDLIVDLDGPFLEDMLPVYRLADEIVWVGDGSEISDIKLTRAYEALSTLDAGTEDGLADKVSLIYNKFSNKTGRVVDLLEPKRLGGVPRYEHMQTAEIQKKLETLDIFDRIGS